MIAESFSRWANRLPNQRPPLSLFRISAIPISSPRFQILPTYNILIGDANQQADEAAFNYYWFLKWGMGYRNCRNSDREICNTLLGTAPGRTCDCEVVVDKNGIPLVGWIHPLSSSTAIQRRARNVTIRRLLSNSSHLWSLCGAARRRHAQSYSAPHLRNDMWLSISSGADAWNSRYSYHASRDGLLLCRRCFTGSQSAVLPIHALMAASALTQTSQCPQKQLMANVTKWIDHIGKSTPSWMTLLVVTQSLATVLLGYRREAGRPMDRATNKFVNVVDLDEEKACSNAMWQSTMSSCATSDIFGKIVQLMSTSVPQMDSFDALMNEALTAVMVRLPLLEGDQLFAAAQRSVCEVLFLSNFIWTIEARQGLPLSSFNEIASRLSKIIGRLLMTFQGLRTEQQNQIGNPREVTAACDRTEFRGTASQPSSVAQSGLLLTAVLPSTSVLSAGDSEEAESAQEFCEHAPYRRSHHSFLLGGIPDYDFCGVVTTQMAASVHSLISRADFPAAEKLASQLGELLSTLLWDHYSRFGFFCRDGGAHSEFLDYVSWLSIPSAAMCVHAPRKVEDSPTLLCLEFEQARISAMGFAMMSLVFTNPSAAFSTFPPPVHLSLIEGDRPRRPVASPSGVLNAADVVLPWVRGNCHQVVRETLGQFSIGLSAADRLHDALQLMVSCHTTGVIAKALRSTTCRSVGLLARNQRIDIVMTSPTDVASNFNSELLSSRVKPKRRHTKL